MCEWQGELFLNIGSACQDTSQDRDQEVLHSLWTDEISMIVDDADDDTDELV